MPCRAGVFLLEQHIMRVSIPSPIGGICGDFQGRYYFGNVGIAHKAGDASAVAVASDGVALVFVPVEVTDSSGQALPSNGVFELPADVTRKLKKGWSLEVEVDAEKMTATATQTAGKLRGEPVTAQLNDVTEYSQPHKTDMRQLIPPVGDKPLVSVVVNADRLRDMLKAMGDGETSATLHIYSPHRPIVVSGDKGRVGIMSPVRTPDDADTALRRLHEYAGDFARPYVVKSAPALATA
jgi:hypothetical protein